MLMTIVATIGIFLVVVIIQMAIKIKDQSDELEYLYQVIGREVNK